MNIPCIESIIKKHKKRNPYKNSDQWSINMKDQRISLNQQLNLD